MLVQTIALLVATTVSLALAQSNCSPKFLSADDGQPCEYFVGKPDTFRVFATILFTRPMPSEEKTPENIQKLRKWTDSVFNNHDIRYPDSKARVLPPPDSLLGWAYGHLLFEKSTLLALAEKDFIKEIEYFETLPQTVILRPRPQLIKVQEPGPYYDAVGRLTAPLRSEIPGPSRGIQVRFLHRR